jgi:hypothetical protein
MSIFEDGKLTKEGAEQLLNAAKKQQQWRADMMPSIDDALSMMTQAYHRLKELGWREAMYCPKDGSTFEVIECGSTGIFNCHYNGKWPNGWWISEDGDLWPSHPVLWRPTPDTSKDVGNTR